MAICRASWRCCAAAAFLSAVLAAARRASRTCRSSSATRTLPDELRRFGVVVATYGVDGDVTGVLGVLGPTRMSYWRSISTVRYMARLMSDLMADLYSGIDSSSSG